MSIKSKVLATAATLALVGGVGTAGVLGATGAANAETPSCGNNCSEAFSPLFGDSFVTDVWRQHIKIGQPIILFRTSQFDPAEDFVAENPGLVSDYQTAGLVGANVALHYGGLGTCAILTNQKCADDPAFEIEYAPYGVLSGLCVGLNGTAAQEEGVTLQNCGVSSKTVWIADIGFYPGASASTTVTVYQVCFGKNPKGNPCPPNTPTVTVTKTVPASPASFCTGGSGLDDPVACNNFGFFPLINGSDTNFSHPYVLTYPNSGYPTDQPRPELQVDQLTGFSNGAGPIVGQVDENQLWTFNNGVLY